MACNVFSSISLSSSSGGSATSWAISLWYRTYYSIISCLQKNLSSKCLRRLRKISLKTSRETSAGSPGRILSTMYWPACFFSWVTSQTVSLPRWCNWGSVKRNVIQHIFISLKWNWDNIKSRHIHNIIHAVFFISNTVEFRLVLYLKVPRFLTSFVTYFVPYFSLKICDSVGLILVSVLKSGG